VFRTISVFENRDLAELARHLAANTMKLAIHKHLDRFPQPHEIHRILASLDPQLILLEIAPDAMPIVSTIHTESPGTSIIGFGGAWARDHEDAFRDVGLTELLTPPISLEEFDSALRRVLRKVRAKKSRNLYGFLPSKAGSGASTVALNTASLIAGTLGKNVLVIEADLHSGVLSTLLNVTPQGHLRNALASIEEMDQHTWKKFVVRAHGVDFALSDKSKKEPVPDWSDYRALLDFVLPRYDFVFVDLPEVVNDATEEVVVSAERVFVVSTPELPSLALAQQRAEELKQHGVQDTHIQIILNRWHSSDVASAEVEKLVGHPVVAVLPNDYRAVHKTIQAGTTLDNTSKLGKALLKFASEITGGTGSPAVKQSMLGAMGWRR
jgi:pilus assembly protein CpaE